MLNKLLNGCIAYMSPVDFPHRNDTSPGSLHDTGRFSTWPEGYARPWIFFCVECSEQKNLFPPEPKQVLFLFTEAK